MKSKDSIITNIHILRLIIRNNNNNNKEAKEISITPIIKSLINNSKVDNNTPIVFFIDINYLIIELIANKTSNIGLVVRE